MHILFCRHIWAELSLPFWTFLSGTFFPGGGGGGVHVHPVHPPCVRAGHPPLKNPGSATGEGRSCELFTVAVYVMLILMLIMFLTMC